MHQVKTQKHIKNHNYSVSSKKILFSKNSLFFILAAKTKVALNLNVDYKTADGLHPARRVSELLDHENKYTQSGGGVYQSVKPV